MILDLFSTIFGVITNSFISSPPSPSPSKMHYCDISLGCPIAEPRTALYFSLSGVDWLYLPFIVIFSSFDNWPFLPIIFLLRQAPVYFKKQGRNHNLLPSLVFGTKSFFFWARVTWLRIGSAWRNEEKSWIQRGPFLVI